MDVFAIPYREEVWVQKAQSHLDSGNFSEATKCITAFNLEKKFNVVDLCGHLVENNMAGMVNKILDKVPEIRMSVISLLLKPQYLKIAIRLVHDYNFDPE